MQLIGKLDSPFVRRVAISLRQLGLAFERANWSVGKDLDKIVPHNPLGQVPVLVLDDGEVLIESAMILDYLDQRVGPMRALVPAGGAQRRAALQLIALALGFAEKARAQLYEVLFRPAEKRHEPYRVRVRHQMIAAAESLDRACAARGPDHFLIGDELAQPDITATCMFTYACEVASLTVDEAPLPALRAFVARCEALPAFRETYRPFDAPVVT
jgi:glutathione S-transferase